MKTKVWELRFDFCYRSSANTLTEHSFRSIDPVSLTAGLNDCSMWGLLKKGKPVAPEWI